MQGALERRDLGVPIGRWPILGRQVANFDYASGTNYRQPLDQIGELAHISRPRTQRQCAEHTWRDLYPSAAFGLIVSDAIAHQRRQILDPRPQRRYLIGKYVEAMKQIFAKQTALDRRFEIAVS